MVINEKKPVKTMVVKSNLPASDYVVNPYVGCPHQCMYCYASFMKRFTQHKEPWGSFLDVKEFETMGKSDLTGKVVLISSVTDAYNPYEKKYQLMPDILNNLDLRNANIEILTKSSLVLRDVNLLKKLKNIKVGISMNTLDDTFRKRVEPAASSVKERLRTLKELKENTIPTYLFVAPIFPEITNVAQIVKETEGFVDEYGFENLNLSGNEKRQVMNLIANYYPEKQYIYEKIYENGDEHYWDKVEKDIENLFLNKEKRVNLYFYHKRRRKNGN